jgi:hypothetical protein
MEITVAREEEESFFDIFDFGDEGFPFNKEFEERGSVYSLSVTYYEHGKPVVKVKTHGKIDTNELRKDLEQKYLGSKIEGLDEKPIMGEN